MTIARNQFRGQIVRMCVCLGLAVAFLSGRATKAQDTGPGKDARALDEFNNGVHNYIEIHSRAKKKLGLAARTKVTHSGQDIVKHEHALAKHISGMRTGANEGDIFTAEVSAYFARVLDAAYQSNAGGISAALSCVSEVVEQKMNPNDVYPETWGYNMMPPTMLLHMPPLPQKLEYNIVNRDMILRDVDANLVVDVMRNAITFPLRVAECDE